MCVTLENYYVGKLPNVVRFPLSFYNIYVSQKNW